VDGMEDDAENRVSNDTSVVLLIYKIILPGKANTLRPPARSLQFGPEQFFDAL
jgi:hypothetical protein